MGKSYGAGVAHAMSFGPATMASLSRTPEGDAMQPMIPAHATQARRHRRALSAEARAALRDYASARSPWPVPFTWLQVAGHEIVMLECAASLEEESDALQNGIASCEPECRAGQL